ncbi:otefin [Drosophila willistoni]|nr:otefin [Drosophila willistoni]
MEDQDTLSNAELKAKMVSQGLPNIAVTDSSRNVLVKRLRASLAGETPGSPSSAGASPKKSSKRRDTLQPSNSSEAKETERRSRMVEKKTKQPASLVPKQTRRKSNTNTAPPSIEDRDGTKKLETIVDELQPPTRNVQNEKTVEDNSVIVLESDGKEDDETKSSTKTLDYDSDETKSARKTLEDDSVIVLESDDEEDEKTLKAPNLVSVASQIAIGTHGSRYSSYTMTNTSSATTRYRHSPAAPLYMNRFVRNLARLRAANSYSRRTVAGYSFSNVDYELQARYKPHAPRALRPEDTSVSVAFSNWINSLDEKFGLESIIFLLVVVLILIGLYIIFH